MDEFVGNVEARCPNCGETSPITIRWPIAEALCSACQQRFQPDEVLIKGYYNCDDDALWHLELLYRGELVKFFLDHNVSQTDAEELQINLFGEVQRSKGQDTGRYDSDSRRSFKTWIKVKAKLRLIDKTRTGARFSTPCPECGDTVPYLASESDRLNRNDGSDPSKPCPKCGANVHLPREARVKSVPFSAVSEDGAAPEFDATDNEKLFGAYEQAFGNPFEAAVVHEHVDALEECKAALDPREQLALQVWLEHSGARGTGNELVNRLKAAFPNDACSAATASRLTQRALEKIGACLASKGIELGPFKHSSEPCT